MADTEITASGTPNGAPRDATRGTANGAPRDATRGTANGAPRDATRGTANGAPRDARTGTANGAPRDARTGTANGAPRDARTGTANGAPRDARTGTANGAPRDATTGTANGAPHHTATRSSRTKPYGASRPPAAGTSTARQVRTVILVALLTAVLLDSAGFVGSGQGMPPGLSRTLILAVGLPVDAAARILHLGDPKRWLDAALGHPDVTAGGAGMESGPPLPTRDLGAIAGVVSRNGELRWGGERVTGGSRASAAAHLRRPHLRLRRPTRSDPLRVLVTGDSLSDYIGQQLAAITAGSGLVDVTTTARDGTGLTNPGLFNWEIGARQEVTGQRYDAVVMVVGANDGWPMRANGRAIKAVASSAWASEYARRIVTVEHAFTAGGRGRQVLWVGPPVARSATWARIFARLNSAARFAAPLEPGGQYVDIAGPTSAHGRYADYLSSPGGRPVLARQPDGVHFSYEGSVFPARVILRALEADFGRLTAGSPRITARSHRDLRDMP